MKYTFEHPDEDTRIVNTDEQKVEIWERGGWGRSYTFTYPALEMLAARWNTTFDSNAAPGKIAEKALMLHRAENHGFVDSSLRPPFVLTEDDEKIIDGFSNLVDRWGADWVFKHMDENIINKLKDENARK